MRGVKQLKCGQRGPLSYNLAQNY